MSYLISTDVISLCVCPCILVVPTRVRLNNYRRDLVIRTCVLVSVLKTGLADTCQIDDYSVISLCVSV